MNGFFHSEKEMTTYVRYLLRMSKICAGRKKNKKHLALVRKSYLALSLEYIIILFTFIA